MVQYGQLSNFYLSRPLSPRLMKEELERCVTMLFRRKGRNELSEKEFVFSASIDLHWFPPADAQKLLDICRSEGLLRLENDYLRPAFDMASVDVPVAFKPDKELLKARPRKRAEKPEGLFPRMMGMAEAGGMERRRFISKCNGLQDRLDVEIEVAGILVLREEGHDVSGLLEEAGSLAASR